MAIISMLIGLLAAFFIYNDGKKRGHGAIKLMFWSVSSLVMPYVIVPLYFLLGRSAKEQDQYYDNDVIDIEATVVEETMCCTRCGNEINEDFLVCPYCQEPTANNKKDN